MHDRDTQTDSNIVHLVDGDGKERKRTKILKIIQEVVGSGMVFPMKMSLGLYFIFMRDVQMGREEPPSVFICTTDSNSIFKL